MAIATTQRNHPAEIRRTLQLAMPVIIGQIGVLGMNFIDTVMSGRLPEKDIALAGLGTGGAIWSAMMMLVIGSMMAVQPTVAQLDGANRRLEAGAQTRQALYLAIWWCFPYALVLFYSGSIMRSLGIDPQIIPVAENYLRALVWGIPAICLVFLLRFFSEGSGHTRPTMFYGLLGALLNIPLNYVLMYGKFGLPALGTTGCGYATSIVLWLQALMLLYYIRKHRHFKDFELFKKPEPPDWKVISELLRLGLPIGVTIFVEGSLFVAAALLIAKLGPVPSAAHLVSINFAALVFMVPLGLTTAITVRVGNALGRGDPHGARYAGLIGLAIAVGFATFSASFIFLFPELIVAMYTDDPAVTSLALGLLFLAAIFQLSDGVQIAAAGCLRGYKDTRIPMIINVLAYWLVGLTSGYFLTFNAEMGPSGMWIGMILGLTVAAILLTSRFLVTSKRHILEIPA
ncbi:MAG TPA: MATE family efflux transporter [Xanthomonadales bacterium]|nr:MATE family efflux transporter [Xanthomonadales bacterium]